MSALSKALLLAAPLIAAADGLAQESADPPGGAPPTGAPPTGTEVVEAYNRRPLGSAGVRNVAMELWDEGQLKDRFEIVHAWQERAGEVRSLVVLEHPAGLRGTSYLLVEKEPSAGTEVFLVLAAGKRQLLKIQPSRFDEGLLGSDFGYNDLLWRIPLAGRTVRFGGASELDGVPVWVVEVELATEDEHPASYWRATRHYIGRADPVLHGSDYFESEEALAENRPGKRLRVSGWKQVDGVWTPERMRMTLEGARESVLELARASFHLPPLPADLFASSTLPAVAGQVEAGNPPPGLADFFRWDRR